MKPTRRAALAMMAGSGGLLAADTMGLSRATAERDLSVAVVPDDEAYLALTEDDVAGDLLFETEPAAAAVRFFGVGNHLTEPVDVTLRGANRTVRFAETAAETYPCEWTTDLTLADIEVGNRRGVAISPVDPGQDGPISDVVEVDALTESGGTSIAADRDVDLYPEDYHAVIRVPKWSLTITVWTGTDDCAPVLEVFHDGQSVACIDLPWLDGIGRLQVPLARGRWGHHAGPSRSTTAGPSRSNTADSTARGGQAWADLEVVRRSDRVDRVRPTAAGFEIEFVDGDGRERVAIDRGR